MDWLKTSAMQQGRAIEAGLLDPLDQAEAYLDAANKHPDGARIYARITESRARSEAIAAHDRAKAGLRRGLLDGVCLSWKDNIDSNGIETEAGSRLLEGRLPRQDADILAQATREGMVCLGKTHMTELAFSGLGLNPMTATPPNALDPDRAPGGSSSGAAVSVALGLAAAAIGTDTGGSVRVPAAWNDVTGFKPTHGGISSTGLVPLCRRFDVAGPIARTVEDCACIFSSLTNSKPIDLNESNPSGLRLLVLEGIAFEDAEPQPVAAVQDAVSRLSARGAKVSSSAPELVRKALALSPLLFAPEAYGIWRAQIEDSPELMHNPVRERFRAGAKVSAPDYVSSWETLNRLRREWAALVAGYDGILLPTAPILPPETAKLLADEGYFTRANLLTLRNTRIGNLLGLPAVSLPTGHRSCGLMVLGHAGGDRHLLRVVSAIEAGLSVKD